MALGETAKLVASLQLDTKKFDSGVAKANKSLGLLGHTASTALGVGIANVATKGLSILSGAIESGIQGALELERAMNATAAVIQSTGGAAGVTADQVRDLANATEELTGVDDKTVQQGENLLLTFTAIGKDVFPAATAAAVNMAVALNKGDAATADIDASAIRLGKALQDPIKGMTALRKAGVNFTQAQQDQIKALVKAGKLQEAQKVILAELAVEFGEAGKAAQKGFAGDLNRANDAIEEAQISIAQGLIPALGEVARELTVTLKDPQVKEGLINLGKGLGAAIKAAVAFAKTVPWGAIATSLRAAAGFAKDLLNAFLGLPTWVQTAVITGWGLNKLTGGAFGGLISSLASGLIKGVLGINAGIVNVNAATVAGVGAGAPIPGFSPTAQGSGGLSGLIKGIPIIGAALAGAEFANIAAPIIAEKIKGVTPEVSSGIAAGATQAIVGALTGPLGFPNLISGIQSIAGNIAAIIPLIDAKPPGGSEQDIEKLRGAISEGLHPEDIEKLRGGIESELHSNSLDDAVRAANIIAAENIGSHNTSTAATLAGFNAANASRSAGHEVAAAVAANRPITNVTVEISATNVDRVNVVEDRGGERSGSRNGDGAGFGPAGR